MYTWQDVQHTRYDINIRLCTISRFPPICTFEYNTNTKIDSRHEGVQIPNCWVKKAIAWSIPASDFVAISSLSRSWKIFHRFFFSNPCHGKVLTCSSSEQNRKLCIAVRHRDLQSRSEAKQTHQNNHRSTECRTDLYMRMKNMLWLCHRHSLRPSMKTKGEIRSSRNRLFNKNICADCNSLDLRRYESWRSDRSDRFKRIMSTMP